MRTIGLIAAMPEECRPLLKQVKHWVAGRIDSFPSFRFQMGDCDCLLVQSGIGMKLAGQAARALLAAGRPEVLVSFGVAGAIKPGLQIGDVVTLRSVYRLENGYPAEMLQLADFSAKVQEAIDKVLKMRSGRLVCGTALTTRGSQVITAESLLLENPVLEMETFAIAQAAAEAGVPMVALRGVSDNPAEPLPIDPGKIMDEDGHIKVGRLIHALLQNPKLILRVNRLRLNTARSAENASIAVMAVLSSPFLTGV